MLHSNWGGAAWEQLGKNNKWRNTHHFTSVTPRVDVIRRSSGNGWLWHYSLCQPKLLIFASLRGRLLLWLLNTAGSPFYLPCLRLRADIWVRLLFSPAITRSPISLLEQWHFAARLFLVYSILITVTHHGWWRTLTAALLPLLALASECTDRAVRVGYSESLWADSKLFRKPGDVVFTIEMLFTVTTACSSSINLRWRSAIFKPPLWWNEVQPAEFDCLYFY